MKKRLLSAVLAVCMLFGSAAALPEGVFSESTGITASAEVSGDFEYTKLDDGTATITGYKGSADTLKIPSKLGGMKVTGIGSYSFDDSTTLKEVTIPDTVTSIGEGAFDGCSSLASVKLSSKLKTIGNFSFYGTGLKKVTVPDSVTTVGDSAFSSCKALTSVVLGKNVKSIGTYAFYYCENLESITIPSSVKVIEDSAFDGTKWLENQRKKNPLVIVNDILVDAKTAKGKVTIPDSVRVIGDTAFSRNYSVTSISIPKSVTTTGEFSFFMCSALTAINVNSENTKLSSENGILYNKKKTRLIACPPSKTKVTISSTVTEINKLAFSDCSNLESVTFPKSLKTIGNGAFERCGSLKSAVLPKGVQTIDENAFEYCKLLEKVTLPEGLTTIGYRAFYGCPCLKTVTVPKSVTSIGNYAFGKYYDYSIRKDSNVEGFVLLCYVDSAGERYASDAGIEYKLIDSKVPDGFEQSGAKKISETPFKPFSANDFGFGIYSNEKNNGLYVINQSVLYFISASTGKTSKVFDFSSLVSDTITNTYVCGNKLYAVGSHYTNNGTANSIYIFNLDTKKFVKRISTKIDVSSVAADTKGNIFVSDGGKIYMLSSAGKKISEVSVGDNTVYRFTGYDETNGNLYFEGYLNYIYWGYNHPSTSLFSANVKNNKLSFTSIYIDAFYQHGVANHNCSSVLLDGKYLAYTCRFMSSKVGFIDSNKFDLTKDSMPYIFGVYRDELEPGKSGYDNYSYGVRAQYVKGTDSFVIYGNSNTLFEMDKKGNQLSTFKTLAHVFCMNRIGDNIVIVEQQDSKSYYLEVIPWKKATKVTISAPSTSTVVAKTIKLSAKTDSALDEKLTWTSSNTKVATVSADGKVYATGKGTATITVATNNGIKDSVKITVKDNTALVNPDLKTASKGAKSINASAQDYTVWASVNNSYIYEDNDQNIWRAEYIGTKIKVEKYSKGAKELLATYTVTPELPIFGGVYFSSDYNYVVTGKANPKYDDKAEVLRITRYTKHWNKVDHVSVKGANTYEPFHAGSCRFAEAGGKLYIHTCHTMYDDGDGLNHQANMTFVVNKSKMKVVDSYYGVMNIAQAGYVSHSFNQFIKLDGKQMYRVDHGDAYPRGVTITAFNLSDKVTNVRYTIPVTYDGTNGYNYTGVSVGGFEISKQSCIIAYSEDIEEDTSHRNIYVSVTDKLFNSTKKVKLTSFTKSSEVRASTPQLVKVSDYLFAVLWEERDLTKDTRSVKAMLIDGAGKRSSSIVTIKGRLSDCQPILCKDGCIRWYSTNGTSPTFYAVQPFKLAGLHEHKYGKPTWTWTGTSAATAKFVCSVDTTEVSTVKAKVTSKNYAATCKERAKTVYTATVTFNSKTYTTTKTVYGPETLGEHKFTAWKTAGFDFSKNTSTQTRKCSVCGKTEKRTNKNAIERLGGANRYGTAAVISTKMLKTAETVIIATGMTYHDALVAVPLAKAYNAPLLLATEKKLTDQTKAELERLKAKNVIVVSTNGAIGDGAKAELSSYETTYIEGKTCFETAAKVAVALQEKTKKAPDTLFFATDSAFADALSASPVAAIKGAPIIYLKKSGSLDKATADYLKSVKGKVKNAYIIGGDGVISDSMMKNVATALGLTVSNTVQRVAGKNRYETCTAVNDKFKSLLTGDGICVAKALDFPDALAGGIYAASTKQALFLAEGKMLLDCQKTYLKSKSAARITVFGGTGAVSDELVKLIAKASV